MIDTLKIEIKKILSKDNRYVSDRTVNINLVYLLNLKYLCDNNKYTYEEIIKLESLDKLNITEENRLLSFGKILLNKLLPLIQYEDIKELVKEYLNQFNKRIINYGEPILCAHTIFDYSLYDTSGNTTYIIDKLTSSKLGMTIFKFFDQALNLNNKYLSYNEINLNDYKYLYIYDFAPRYRFIKNSDTDVYQFIYYNLRMNNDLKIILHTDFKKASNMRDARVIIKDLKKVLFFDDTNTYLLFQKTEDNNVSIINYNKDKITTLDRLFEVISQNRKTKDVLTKTTTEDIINNRYRLGFKLYQNKLKNDTRNINEIVDENTSLINELSSLNKTIEMEINNLMNK